jgi:uncharacterized membrane protein YdbT with pleckstrin-like domain
MAFSPIGIYRAFRPPWQAFGVYYFGVFIFLAGPQINPDTFISPALGQLLASIIAGFILVTRFTRVYRVSDDEVEVEKTFPSHHTETVKIKQIRRIDLRRGMSQRFLGVAHVHIYVEGHEAASLKLFGVPKPEKFKQILLDRGAGNERVYGAFRS